MSTPVLTDLLTSDQMQLLLHELRQLFAAGYGELAISVRAGRPRFLRTTISLALLAPEPGRGKGRVRFLSAIGLDRAGGPGHSSALRVKFVNREIDDGQKAKADQPQATQRKSRQAPAAAG